MKTFSGTCTCIILTMAVLVVAGCDRGHIPVGAHHSSEVTSHKSNVFDGRDSVATGGEGLTATQTNFTIVTDFLLVEGDVGVGLVGIDSPEQLESGAQLYESRGENAVLAPDNHHVTWGEFSGAEGAVVAKCTREGTHTVSHFAGLIPQGLYSVWIKVFDPDTGGLIGQLSHAGPDTKGNGNVFRASADGEGHISGSTPPGVLDEVGDCMPADVQEGKYEWQVAAVYHIDGDPGIGDDDVGTFVEQAAFLFETAESPPVVE